MLNEEKRKLNDLKEQFLDKETSILRGADLDKKELVANYERVVRELSGRVEGLQKAN